MTAITAEDEGKRVVDSNGEMIGRVSNVRDGKAFVDPDPGITGTIKSKLGWEDEDMEDYPLNEHEIESVTDDEIRLRSE